MRTRRQSQSGLRYSSLKPRLPDARYVYPRFRLARHSAAEGSPCLRWVRWDLRRSARLTVLAETKKSEETKGTTRTNSELDTIAEKAALLGREAEEEEPTSPMEERRHPLPADVPHDLQPLTSPGDLNVITDPLSLASPTSEAPEPDYLPHAMSEKAMGKMRATESVTSLASVVGEGLGIPDEELMKVAAAGVGPNGYIPTQEWVSSWQKGYVNPTEPD